MTITSSRWQYNHPPKGSYIFKSPEPVRQCTPCAVSVCRVCATLQARECVLLVLKHFQDLEVHSTHIRKMTMLYKSLLTTWPFRLAAALASAFCKPCHAGVIPAKWIHFRKVYPELSPIVCPLGIVAVVSSLGQLSLQFIQLKPLPGCYEHHHRHVFLLEPIFYHSEPGFWLAAIAAPSLSQPRVQSKAINVFT